MRNLGFQRWWMITGYRKPRPIVGYSVTDGCCCFFIIIVVTVIINEVLLPIRKSNRSSYISFRKYSSGDYLLCNTLSIYDFSALRPLLTDL